MNRPDDTKRSCPCGGKKPHLVYCKCRRTILLCPKCAGFPIKPDDSRSLIAFVQKHKLDVQFEHTKKFWDIHIRVHKFESRCIGKGKTWIAAVRKAKRVIEKGKL